MVQTDLVVQAVAHVEYAAHIVELLRGVLLAEGALLQLLAILVDAFLMVGRVKKEFG